MADYNGYNVRVIVREGVSHIFSLAIFEDFLYWTDWETAKIEKAHKFSGKNRTQVVNRMPNRPMGIRVVHSLLQPKSDLPTKSLQLIC